MEAFTRHGGRLAEAQARFPDVPRPWLDLSTGVSPHAYPAPRATLAERARLPDPGRLRALEAVAAVAFGTTPERVAAVAGAEAGLRLLPHLLGASTLHIAEPTYGGHAEAWLAAAAELRHDHDLAQAVVVVNPNNPDGRITPRAELLALADRLGARGGHVIVDESFAEAAPSHSVAGRSHPALIVLRSFGKAYGLPGLRLGFVLADPGTAARVRAALGDWPVCADALAAGLVAYADPRWLARARLRWRRSADRLDGLLARAGFEPVGGTDLFRLVRTSDAAARFRRLAGAGVLVRPFAHDPALLRFGLPPAGAWSRLARALERSR